LHEDLTVGFVGEIRAGFADLKATLIEGFNGLATRESFEEMVGCSGSTTASSRFTFAMSTPRPRRFAAPTPKLSAGSAKPSVDCAIRSVAWTTTSGAATTTSPPHNCISLDTLTVFEARCYGRNDTSGR